MMNVQPYLRTLLIVLLLGAQWWGTMLVPCRSATSNLMVLASLNSPANQRPVDLSLSQGNDCTPHPAVLRFNGRMLVGLEDSLTLFQEVEASANSPLDLPIDPTSGSNDTLLAGSAACLGQSLFLQHTRLQI